jgi:hypothetical protein
MSSSSRMVSSATLKLKISSTFVVALSGLAKRKAS